MLVGGLEHFLLGIIIPMDFHIFQRGSNHQPGCYSSIHILFKPSWDETNSWAHGSWVDSFLELLKEEMMVYHPMKLGRGGMIMTPTKMLGIPWYNGNLQWVMVCYSGTAIEWSCWRDWFFYLHHQGCPPQACVIWGWGHQGSCISKMLDTEQHD